MVLIKYSGDFKNTENFLTKAAKMDCIRILGKYGREGVSALSSATPIGSGLTSSSWGYEVSTSGSSFVISWTNSHIVDGVPIAVILQYGHGTRNGGYVRGQDYINPAIRPIFNRIADEAWKAVIR